MPYNKTLMGSLFEEERKGAQKGQRGGQRLVLGDKSGRRERERVREMTPRAGQYRCWNTNRWYLGVLVSGNHRKTWTQTCHPAVARPDISMVLVAAQATQISRPQQQHGSREPT